jgi:hypothetical protein
VSAGLFNGALSDVELFAANLSVNTGLAFSLEESIRSDFADVQRVIITEARDRNAADRSDALFSLDTFLIGKTDVK